MKILMGLVFSGLVAAASANAQDIPHGINFTFKSGLDTNFCVTQENAGPNSPITLEVCDGGDDQEWALTYNVHNTNLMVSYQGFCLSVRGRVPGDHLAVKAPKCSHSDEEEFVYTVFQQFMNESSGNCLSVAKAIGGEPVSLEVCDQTSQNQVFHLGH